MERMSGNDAVLWHMEDDETPLHTLKIVILDSSRRGRAVTLDDVALALGPRLGLVPRSTQKVLAPPGFGARPFWVDDPDFDLRAHLDERTLPGPGDARQLDDLYAELARTDLARDRSPWTLTLVHGLEGGRQAVVVRVHHALVDGLGALNTFLAATTDAPGGAVALRPAATPPAISRARLARIALVDTLRAWMALVGLVRRTARLAARRARLPRRRPRTCHPSTQPADHRSTPAAAAGPAPVRPAASTSA